MAYGSNAHLGISFQSSFGTSNTTSMHWFPIISETLTESIPEVMSEAQYARFEEGPSYRGMTTYEGDVSFESNPVLLGKLLKAWFGQASSTLVTSHYSHTFVPVTEDFCNKAGVPPCTIEVYRDAGSAHLFSDMLLNQLVIEIAHGAIVKCTGSFIGANRAKSAKSTPSYLSGSDYTFDQTSIEWAGSANDTVQTLTVTMNNALEATGTLNTTRRPSRIKRNGNRTIEIAGTMLFENDTEYDKYLASTGNQIVTTLTGQSVSSGYNASLTMDFPSVRYNDFPVNISGPGLISVSFTAKAKYHTGSGNIATFTMVNTQSLY